VERGTIPGLKRGIAASIVAWVAAAPFVAWAVVRLLGLDGGFPLEAMMPFTPYVAAASVLAVALGLALGRRAPAAVAAIAALCLAAVVLPRQFGSDLVSAKGHRTLNVLAANVHHGGADPAGLMRLVDELRPDVLTIEEFTPSFGRKMRAAGLESRLRYHVENAAKSASGTAIYSRFPLRRLPTPNFRFRMSRAEATMPTGGKLRIEAVHPIPPRHSAWIDEWEEVLKTLPSGGHGTPWLLSGDFNATFDQSPFRDLVDRGYIDAGKAAGKGLDATFPATGTFLPPPITIDHILADDRWHIVEYEVEPLPNSDHHAIFAQLALPGR
jgi:endonuclease/exonuclease/phosphatase (EEP) superfamily protein YafD